ncbi:MAG TPA: hypothetical protein VIL86_20305 [Tepidisphaeraceae bacterium]|jgi:hypothetical protein
MRISLSVADNIRAGPTERTHASIAASDARTPARRMRSTARRSASVVFESFMSNSLWRRNPRIQCPADAPEQASFIPLPNFVFPHPQHRPPLHPQRPNHERIAFPVGLKFRDPKLAVVHRCIRMLRAVVPEAPVDENGQPFSAKHEIGISEDGEMPTPRCMSSSPRCAPRPEMVAIGVDN